MQKYHTDLNDIGIDQKKLLDGSGTSRFDAIYYFTSKDKTELPIFLTASEKFFVLNRGYIAEGTDFGQYASDNYKTKRIDSFIQSYRQSANWIKKNVSVKDNIFKEAAYLIGMCKNRISFGSNSIKFKGTDAEITIYIDSSGRLQYERG